MTEYIYYKETGSPPAFTGQLVGLFQNKSGKFVLIQENITGDCYLYENSKNLSGDNIGEHFHLKINTSGKYDEIEWLDCVFKYSELTEDELSVAADNDEPLTTREIEELKNV